MELTSSIRMFHKLKNFKVVFIVQDPLFYSTSPLPPFSRAIFFLHKIGVHEREGVDEKSNKNDIRRRARIRRPFHKFFHVVLSVTQSFFLGFL